MQHKISKARSVWRRLVKLLQQEGEDICVSYLFYREVIQAVLMSRLDSWVLSDAMMWELEGTQVGF